MRDSIPIGDFPSPKPDHLTTLKVRDRYGLVKMAGENEDKWRQE